MGELAAWHADSAIPEVLLRRAGYLPADRRRRRQHRRAGGRPSPVAGVHARRDDPAVEYHRPAGTILAGTAALLGLAVAADRGGYLGGFERTMLTHVADSASAQSVLGQSWYWAGLLLLLAVSGVVISVATRQAAAQSVLLVFLTAALIFGPLEQAHLHTVATLNHHVGLGAWFAAIAAGYAVDW